MAIREYPLNDKGNGDIDSGPVIWDIGTAATIVGQKAAIANDDYELASDIYKGINSLGFTFQLKDKRTFLGGVLPIADGFIAWSRADLDYKKLQQRFYWKFHLISFLITLTFGPLIYWLAKRSTVNYRA